MLLPLRTAELEYIVVDVEGERYVEVIRSN
jgi:hypothetical protein